MNKFMLRVMQTLKDQGRLYNKQIIYYEPWVRSRSSTTDSVSCASWQLPWNFIAVSFNKSVTTCGGFKGLSSFPTQYHWILGVCVWKFCFNLKC